MHFAKDIFFEATRKVVFRLQKNKQNRWYSHTDRYVTNNINPNLFLYEAIQDTKPFMLSRLGTSELHVILNKLSREQPNYTKYINYLNGIYPDFWWGKSVKNDIAQNSGLFPVDETSLEEFVSIYKSLMPEIDILLSWLKGEAHLASRDYLNPSRTNLYIFDCEPYFYTEPWTLSLRDKKVLVVHPFEDSIKDQYLKRNSLFKHEVLPAFDLITVKAVQSIKGHSTDFISWFEALAYMKAQVASCDFDVALIAAGSYGLPLAAYIKSLGKKALHLGGFLQLFFGIRGRRWELSSNHSNLINEHWKFPYEHEYPKNYNKLDHGSYW